MRSRRRPENGVPGRRIRATVLVLGGIALLIYLGFIGRGMLGG